MTERYGTVPLSGEVVRAGGGETALRFTRFEEGAERVVTEIISREQRRRLRARHAWS